MFLRVWRPPGSSRASTHLPCTTLFRSDGGCLYFTCAAQVDPDQRDSYYRQAWDAGTRAVLAAGGALSHHHGVGLNRSRFVANALGPALDFLVATKAAPDPTGLHNPGNLGLPSPSGPPASCRPLRPARPRPRPPLTLPVK